MRQNKRIRFVNLVGSIVGGQSQKRRGGGRENRFLHLLLVIGLTAGIMLTHGLLSPIAQAGTTVELTDADITLNGVQLGDEAGFSVAKGDINGDGFDDVIIGANNADPGSRSGAGQSYVVFGSATLSGTIELSTADITLNGINIGDNSGQSVSAGDVNGDGFDDIIIGAWFASPGGRFFAGQSYVVYGSSTLSGTVELSTADITLNGIIANDQSGISVSAGDVNGDGSDDVIIGAWGADPGGRSDAGQSYVVFGSSTLSGTIELSAGADIIMNGITSGDTVGLGVSSGDVNGDGFDDVIIGAPLVHPVGGFRNGQSYVVLGSATISGTIELSTADITLTGVNNFDESGRSVSAGDVNDDGFDDIIIGAAVADPGGRSAAGQSYVVFGSATISGTIELSTADITLNGINNDDESGTSVSAGDVNGDGFDDIIIGALNADPGGRSEAGQSYVVFGSATLSGTIELSTGADITLNGINSSDESGFSVGAGDVNGDGVDDVIIGAPFADPGDLDSAGQSYVVFGTPSVPLVSVTTTPDSQIIPRGSVLGIEVTVTNNTDSAQTFDFWTNITLPNGFIFPFNRELIGPIPLTMPAGASWTGNLSFPIPLGATPGIYTYHAYVGSYPDIWDQSDFQFGIAP